MRGRVSKHDDPLRLEIRAHNALRDALARPKQSRVNVRATHGERVLRLADATLLCFERGDH